LQYLNTRCCHMNFLVFVLCNNYQIVVIIDNSNFMHFGQLGPIWIALFEETVWENL
jgi:hypothetical protein